MRWNKRHEEVGSERRVFVEYSKREEVVCFLVNKKEEKCEKRRMKKS